MENRNVARLHQDSCARHDKFLLQLTSHVCREQHYIPYPADLLQALRLS
jgi:hypothetical protein